jgi:hypothetical protein
MTDSQAIDVVHEWTKGDVGQAPRYDVTTFSIALINFMSGGHLQHYVDGLAAFLSLKPDDRLLIAEACNHVRIPEKCDDIGLVQIPRKIRGFYGDVPLQLDHAYGREFPARELGAYKLVIHCGGCMVSRPPCQASVVVPG